MPSVSPFSRRLAGVATAVTALATGVAGSPAFAASPSPAEVTSGITDPGSATSYPGVGMRYNGTDGINKVTVTLAATASGPRFTIDDIVAIKAGAGCFAVPGDTTKVTCTAFKDSNGKFLRFTVNSGAGADVVTNATNTSTGQGVPMLALGGDGDDQLNGVSDRFAEEVLNGGPGVDTLNGGPGGDSLLGGTGTDALHGGDSDDELFGGPDADTLLGEGGHSDDLDGGTGSDLIDGGFGVGDSVVYLTRTAKVSVDLAASGKVNGETNEGDTLTGIENVIGGQGNDTFRQRRGQQPDRERRQGRPARSGRRGLAGRR